MRVRRIRYHTYKRMGRRSVAAGNLDPEIHIKHLRYWEGVAAMIAFNLAPPTHYDFVLAVVSLSTIYSALYVAVVLNRKGKPAWIGRKVIHISAGTIIALVLIAFSSLYAPIVTLAVFLGSMLLASLLDFEIVKTMVLAASREDGGGWGTFAAAAGAIISYGIVFFWTADSPWIFVASVLAVSWGDGAGELVGRPFGKRKYTVLKTTRSLEGSLAVFVLTMFALSLSIALFGRSQVSSIFLRVIIASVAVTILEAVSPYWTDNVFIPLAVAGLLTALHW